MKPAINGAGSLGTVLGAYIAKAGYQIDLINRNAAHVAALKESGAHIVGKVEMTVPVRALLPEEMTETYDLIFLMTKQLDNEAVVRSLLPHLEKEGAIVTMQNGMPELSVSEVVGEARTYGCTVGWGATLLGPGVGELTSEPDSLTFAIGSTDGHRDDKFDYAIELLRTMGTVEIEKNFLGARWSKLLINSAFSGLSAALGCTFGEVSDNKKSRLIAQRIIKECIDVAKAAQIRIEPIQGKDVVKLLDYKGAFKRKISFFIIPIAMKKHRMLKASMLQDLEKGKRCEIEAINGVVSRYGKKYGVPTPCNDKVIEVVRAIEAGEKKPSFDNLPCFFA